MKKTKGFRMFIALVLAAAMVLPCFAVLAEEEKETKEVENANFAHEGDYDKNLTITVNGGDYNQYNATVQGNLNGDLTVNVSGEGTTQIVNVKNSDFPHGK